MPRSNQSKEGENIITNEIFKNPNRKILDVGAGSGKWGKILCGSVYQLRNIIVDAIEIWEPNIKKYKLKEIYNDVFNGDIMNFSSLEKYDTIILGDVLEHLPKEKAIELIKRFTDKQSIYLTIPISKCTQDGKVYGNPYETHLYQWDHLELYDLGFRLLHIAPNENGKVIVGTYKMEKGDTN